jgi:hypothetical protein
MSTSKPMGAAFWPARAVLCVGVACMLHMHVHRKHTRCTNSGSKQPSADAAFQDSTPRSVRRRPGTQVA